MPGLGYARPQEFDCQKVVTPIKRGWRFQKNNFMFLLKILIL